MLMVSDLLDVAARGGSVEESAERVPDRFGSDRSTIPVVVWNVCRHCNMSCPHCYAAATFKPSQKDLTSEEGMALLADLAECGVKHVIFSGGEPLLRADLVTLVRHATDLGLNAHLSSNGVLLDQSKAEALADAGVRYVGVSIDGLAEFNDPYRGMERGFERALEGLACARAAGLRTGLRMTVTRRNAHHLESLLQCATDAAIDRFYVSHLVDAGRALRIVGDDLSPSETRTLLVRLFELADRDLPSSPRIVTGGNDSDGPLLVEWIRGRYGNDAAGRVSRVLQQRGGNSAGERVVNIDHQGRVHPDQFWRKAVLGDLRETSFSAVLRSPLRRDLIRREELLTGRCQGCRYLTMCRGSHRERALNRHGDPWAPDPCCVMRDDEIMTSKRGVA